MGLSARTEAVRSIATTRHKLNHVDFKTTHIKNLFAVNVFSEEVAAGAPAQADFQNPSKDHPQGCAARSHHCRRRRHRP